MGFSVGERSWGGEFSAKANYKIVVLLFAVVLLSIEAGSVRAQAFGLGNWFSEFGSTLPLPSPTNSRISEENGAGSLYAGKGDAGKIKAVADLEEGDLKEEQDEALRRQLRSTRLYISYGALTSRYTPCPPRSGRSYYTRNCKSATGAVRPYTRGCTRISSCARG